MSENYLNITKSFRESIFVTLWNDASNSKHLIAEITYHVHKSMTYRVTQIRSCTQYVFDTSTLVSKMYTKKKDKKLLEWNEKHLKGNIYAQKSILQFFLSGIGHFKKGKMHLVWVCFTKKTFVEESNCVPLLLCDIFIK